MRTIILFVTLVFSLFSTSTFAVNCDKNPSHPNCIAPPAPSASVDKILVDRVNSEIEIHGSGLAGESVSLAGISIPITSSSNDLLVLQFGPELATAVTIAGNYVLSVAGIEHAIYVDGAIVNATFTGCPCGDFNDQLVAEGLTQTAPDCIVSSENEINSEYLALTYPASLQNPPIYVIGAAFVDGAPASSVCQMVKIGAGGSLDYLLSEPVNAAQQSACAAIMFADQRICGQASSP